MNKEDVFGFIFSLIGSFKYHNLMVDELATLLAGSGNEKQFFNLLLKRLKQLSALGVQAVNLEEFENIGQGVYSMHFAGKGFNIRILYSFLPNKEPILLLAFYERAGKSKTSYAPQISTAIDRLNAIREEY